MIDHNIRKLGVGGSDVAALFGVDEYKDQFDVYESKKGDQDAVPPNDHMVAGHILEPAILQLYGHMTDREVAHTNITYQHPTRPFQVYSPDGVVVGEKRGIEAKVVFWQERSKWGWDVNEIPLRVQMQCYWYMSAMDFPRWDVAALVGEGMPRIYSLERLDAAAEKAMLDRVREWYERYLVGDERPPLGTNDATARWLARTYPTHKRPDMRDATPEEAVLLHQYVDVRLAQQKAQELRDRLELALKDAIKDKEGLSWDGNAFTWRRTKDKEYTDWQSMALGLLHNYVKDEADREGIHLQYQRTKEGFRRIYLNHPLFNRAKKRDTETAEAAA